MQMGAVSFSVALVEFGIGDSPNPDTLIPKAKCVRGVRRRASRSWA